MFCLLINVVIIIHHKDIISSKEPHQNMEWFDAGTKTMSGPTFGNFIKLKKLHSTGSWVSPLDRMISQF